MTERVILPREADADMLLAGQKSIEASVIGALRGEPHIAEGAAYRAMRDASPHSGCVSEEEVEKAYEAAKAANAKCTQAYCGDCDCDGFTCKEGVRAALASLGLTVEG